MPSGGVRWISVSLTPRPSSPEDPKGSGRAVAQSLAGEGARIAVLARTQGRRSTKRWTH